MRIPQVKKMSQGDSLLLFALGKVFFHFFFLIFMRDSDMKIYHLEKLKRREKRITRERIFIFISFFRNKKC